MLARPVVPIVASVALQAGLMCNSGFAATLTTSLSVSVTVEAGCQVSPPASVTESAAPAPQRWNSPISVNCSFPVPYQITVTGSPRPDLSRLASTIPGLADLRDFAHAGDRDLLQPHGRSIEPASDSEYSLLRPVSRTCTAAAPGTIIVTIIY